MDDRIVFTDVDSKGTIWMTTDGGGLISYNGDEFTHYTVEDGLANAETYGIHIDDRDYVWVGTFGSGVSIFDGETWGSIDTRDGLIHNIIKALFTKSCLLINLYDGLRKFRLFTLM